MVQWRMNLVNKRWLFIKKTVRTQLNQIRHNNYLCNDDAFDYFLIDTKKKPTLFEENGEQGSN